MFCPGRDQTPDPQMIVFIIVHREVFWNDPDCVPQVAYGSASHVLSLLAIPAPGRFSQNANIYERIRRSHDRSSAPTSMQYPASASTGEVRYRTMQGEWRMRRIARGCLRLQEDHANLL